MTSPKKKTVGSGASLGSGTDKKPVMSTQKKATETKATTPSTSIKKTTTGSGASAGGGEIPSVKNVAKPTPTKNPVDNRTASQKKRMAGMMSSITDKTAKKSAVKRATIPASIKKQMASKKRPARRSLPRRG